MSAEPAVSPPRRRAPHQKAGLFAGPLLGAAVALLVPSLHSVAGYGHRPAFAAAVVVLMATWWLTEAVPIELTACVPLVAYPLLGVFGQGLAGDLMTTGLAFADAYVFLFFGGMAIGAAMEQWNLHRRIALHIMRRVGAEPSRLLLGMLAATAFVSMWISNTATAVMMLPIAVALVRELEKTMSGGRLTELGCALMLAVAYAANVGGIGTKIGTATNSIFAGYVEQRGIELGFLEYSLVAFPFVLLFIPLVWVVLWRVARADRISGTAGRAVIERELALLGEPSRAERGVAVVFTAAALLWIFGDLVRPLVAPIVASALGGAKFLGKHYEATVSLAAATALLVTRLISWDKLRGLPYGSLALLGGSLAMAAGIEASGLNAWTGERLAVLASLSLPMQLFLTSMGTVLLSAVASNTATINVVLNVVPGRLPVLFAATIAASCDFMLPAGTPPNAIVFGSGYVRLSTMMRVGFVLDVAAGVLIAVYMYGYGRFVLP